MRKMQKKVTEKIIENIGFTVALFVTSTIFFYVFPYIHNLADWTYSKAFIIIAVIALIGIWLKDLLNK